MELEHCMQKITFYIDDTMVNNFAPEIEYIIKAFLFRTGIRAETAIQPQSEFSRNDSIPIFYCEFPPPGMKNQYCFIWCDKKFWKDTYYSPPETEAYKFENTSFPVMYKKPGDSQPLVVNESTTHINFDLFASMFYVLARVEEYRDYDCDGHQRFPVKASRLYRSGYIRQPCVDLWAYFLGQQLHSRWNIPLEMSLYNNKSILNLTFDIDLIQYYNLRRIMGSPLIGLIKERRLIAFFAYPVHALGYVLKQCKDPYWGFPIIEKLQKKYQVEPTFFAIPRKMSEWESYDLLHHPRLQDTLLRTIGEQDDLGLHCSYTCLDAKDDYLSEKECLEGIFQRHITGVRHHYLRFSVPESWGAAAKAGLEYDATFGFAEHEGFRAGTAFPFFPYNLEKREEIPIVEIPLAMMDVTLRYYRKKDPRTARREMLELIDVTRNIKGMTSILWHTCNLQGFGWEEWARALERILQKVQQCEDMCFLSCTNIAHKALERRQSLLERFTPSSINTYQGDHR